MLIVSILQSKDTDWQIVFFKKEPTMCCLEEMHLTGNKRQSVKVKTWKKIFQVNESRKKNRSSYTHI
jgi:hypothetical protein